MKPLESNELNLYDLINEHVNAETIKGLLRTIKQKYPKEVLLSESKPTLIETLEASVNRNWIPQIEVFNLLRDVEENGRQKIHYFRPRTKHHIDTLNDANTVGAAIFGEDWESKFAIPKLTKGAHGPAIVDFRKLGETKKDWILKVYTFDSHKKLVNSTKDKNPKRYTETWEEQEERFVLAIRWNAHSTKGWLEFRTSVGLSETLLSKHLLNLWQILKPVIQFEDCQRVDLSKSMNGLFQSQSRNAKSYRIYDIQAWDKDSHDYEVCPHDSDQHTLNSTAHGIQFFDRIIEGGGKIGNLVLEWLPKEEGESPKIPILATLRCIIGNGTALTLNRLSIQAEAPAAAIDYVTDQLRHFG